jgi:S-DNA-T family DNA segregation ATPase FtsK/SpoIIIE
MAESTKSTSRARTSAPRSRTAPTKKLPASKLPPSKAPQRHDDSDEPGLLATGWMSLAHVTGAAFRVFGQENLAKDERRDGVPFFLVLLAIAGVVVEWFNPLDPVALALDAYTFGGLFGRVAFALPVIMVFFAGWLFRHPASVHDNTRIGIGVGLMVSTIAGLCHIFGGQPQPDTGMELLARSGGLIGWVFAAPLIAIGTVWLAASINILLLILSVFIITKTPPNRIGARLGELYAYLFGTQMSEKTPVTGADDREPDTLRFTPTSDLGADDDDPANLPWWRRNKTRREEDPAFDTPVVGRDDHTEVFGTTPGRDTDDFGIELLEDMVDDDADSDFAAAEAAPEKPRSLQEDPAGLLPGFMTRASEKGIAGEFDSPFPISTHTVFLSAPTPARQTPCRSHRLLPAATTTMKIASMPLPPHPLRTTVCPPRLCSPPALRPRPAARPTTKLSRPSPRC